MRRSLFHDISNSHEPGTLRAAPRALRRRSGLLALLMIGVWSVGCGVSQSEPSLFDSGPGHASVMVQVLTPNGSAAGVTTVRIACAGSDEMVEPTATDGTTLTNLSTTASAYDANSGRIACRFTEPSIAPTRAQLDTTLVFSRGPVLVPLQRVTLPEH